MGNSLDQHLLKRRQVEVYENLEKATKLNDELTAAQFPQGRNMEIIYIFLCLLQVLAAFTCWQQFYKTPISSSTKSEWSLTQGE